MASQNDQGIQLQQDTLSPAGPAVRLVLPGVQIASGQKLVDTAQQVVSIADGQGALLTAFQDNTTTLITVLSELREIRRLVSLFMGVNYVPVELPQESNQKTGI
jgi:hypothetical protein